MTAMTQRQATPMVGAPLSAYDIEDLMIYLLRFPQVFNAADPLLEVSHFDFDTESHYALLWSVIQEQWHAYGTLTYFELRRELYNLIQADGSQNYTPQQIDALMWEDPNDQGNSGLLYLAFYFITDDKLNPQAGITLLRRFLHERSVVQPLRTLLNNAGNGVLLDVQAVINATSTQQIRVQGLGQSSVCLPFLDVEEEEEVRDSFPVMVEPFQSNLMHQGQAVGEAYGLMAPPGFGKTTLLTHLAVNTGRYFYSQASVTNTRPKSVWSFTWEEEAVNLRWRIQACAAGVEKQRLESKVLRQQLTSVAENNLLAYERLLQSQGSQPQGERERLADARWVNEVIRIGDMTVPGRGENLYQDVYAELDRAVHDGEQIGMICLDHAMMMADRYIAAGMGKQDHMRHILRQIADGAKQLAIRYRCSVWIAHQARTALAAKSATAKIVTGAGAECGSFEQPLVYSFVLGPPNNDDISLLWCTKDRKTGKAGNSACVRINGALQRIEDCSGQFAVDGMMGRIVNRNETGTIASGNSVTRRAQQTGMHSRRDGVT